MFNVLGIRPKRDTVSALEGAAGLSLAQLPVAQSRTYADVIEQLQSLLRAYQGDKAATRQLGRLHWLLRQTGWVAGKWGRSTTISSGLGLLMASFGPPLS